MKKQMDEYLLAAENPIGKKQRRLFFKRRRASTVLTREQVKAIEQGRKLLKKQLKEQGLKTKEDFELMATQMGLYFDKNGFLLWWRWLMHGRAIWALLGALALLLLTLMVFSSVTQLQGHFTINMSADLFREGFVLSDNVAFENATTYLFCQAAENVPCVSISHLPENVDTIDGQHNEDYFAYTFYIRNEGENTVDYDWEIRLNSESKNVSSAAWVMVFEDGQMLFYAAPDADGGAQVLPARGDDTRGYMETSLPLMQFSRDPAGQFEVITQKGSHTYYRVVPEVFLSDSVVAVGAMLDVEPMEVHKYTVVIWLEGDDPDCTNELIGGHVGMDFNFKLAGEESGDGSGSGGFDWDDFWDSLIFWDDE